MGMLLSSGISSSLSISGCPTSDVRFILSGGVRVIFRAPNGKEMFLGEIGAGMFFGELAAIDGDIRSANVTATAKSRICTMPAAVFRKLLSAHPEVALEVMQVLTGRIRSLNQRIAEHSFLDAKYRLYNELIRLSRPRSGKPDQRIISHRQTRAHWQKPLAVGVRWFRGRSPN